MQKRNNSFFVFLTSLLKTKNEKGIRFSFFVRKFENEKGKNGIYTVIRTVLPYLTEANQAVQIAQYARVFVYSVTLA